MNSSCFSLSILQNLFSSFITDDVLDNIVVACAGRNAALRFERQRLREHLRALKKSCDVWKNSQSKINTAESLKGEVRSLAVCNEAPSQNVGMSWKDSEHGITFRWRYPQIAAELESTIQGTACRNNMSQVPKLFNVNRDSGRDLSRSGTFTSESQPPSFTIPPAWYWNHQKSYPQVALPVSPQILLDSEAKTSINATLSQAPLAPGWPWGTLHMQSKAKEAAQQTDTADEVNTEYRTCIHHLESINKTFFHPAISLAAGSANMYTITDQRGEPPMLGPFYPPLPDHTVSKKILAHRDYRSYPAEFLMPVSPQLPPPDVPTKSLCARRGHFKTTQQTLRTPISCRSRKVRFLEPVEQGTSHDYADSDIIERTHTPTLRDREVVERD